MYTIGFATKFYTLWDVNTYEFWDARRQRTVGRTSYQYMRNLSFELPAAEQKLKDFMPEGMEYKVNLELRGHTSYNDDKVISETPPDPNAAYHFSFGKCKGLDIRIAGVDLEKRIQETVDEFEAYKVHTMQYPVDEFFTAEMRINHLRDKENDMKVRVAGMRKDLDTMYVWQLQRAMKQENTLRRRACARRRLIELGELVRRDWVEKYPLAVEPQYCDINGQADFDAPIKYGEIKRKWMPRRLAEYHTNIGDKKGLFFTEGARIELEIKKVREKCYEGNYGTVHIVNYTTPDHKLITYKGTTPPKTNMDSFVKIKATIKHDRNETFIQRIKA
jgi:hypothetical protein